MNPRSWKLTGVGKLVLGVVALLYLASLTSQSGLLLLLVGLLLGCLVVNVLAARRALRGLELQIPPSTHVTEGQRLWQPWRLANRGSRPAALVVIDSPAGEILRVPQAPPRGEIPVVPDLLFWRRGVYHHDQLRLASGDPFGLVRLSRPLAQAGEVVVSPALYETRAPRAAGYDAVVGGKHPGQRRAGSGVHFAGVRPLQPGDPLKQIHWRSSAKGQGLMVKTYEEELSGRVALIMDSGHSGEAEVLDDCARATGSLVFAALEAGHHVEWVDLQALEPRLIPPFADGRELLDALARVTVAPGCLSSERVRQAVERVSRRSALHLVLTAWTPELEDCVLGLRQQNRQVCVYLPAQWPGTPGVAVPLRRYARKGLTDEPELAASRGAEAPA